MIVCTQCGRHNADGSTFCVEPSCGAFLNWEESQEPGTQPLRGAAPAGEHPGARTVQPGPERHSVQVQLAQREVAVDVGQSATVDVVVANNGTIVEELAIQLAGPAAVWSVVDTPQLSLFPGKQAGVRISFAPPRATDTPTGPVPFQVMVNSRVHHTVAGSESGVLVVAGFAAPAVQISPHTATARLRGKHRLTVANEGNLPIHGPLLARDPDETLRFKLTPQVLAVPPGTRAEARIRSRPRKWLWWGGPVRRPFTVELQTGDQAPIRVDGAVEQVPLIPRAAIPLAAVAMIAALGLGAVTFLRGDAEPGPGAVAGTAAPTTTAATTAGQAGPPATTTTTTTQPPTTTTTSTTTTTEGPPPPPPVRGQSSLNVPFSHSFDLDDGAADPGAGQDIYYSMPGSGEFYVDAATPVPSLQVIGVVEPAYDRCAAASLSEYSIPASGLPAGTVICVRTNAGRLAAIKLSQPPGESLVGTYTTWEFP